MEINIFSNTEIKSKAFKIIFIYFDFMTIESIEKQKTVVVLIKNNHFEHKDVICSLRFKRRGIWSGIQKIINNKLAIKHKRDIDIIKMIFFFI